MSDFDYGRSGNYFITICAKDKFELFGVIDDVGIKLSQLGQSVDNTMRKIPQFYDIAIHNSVIMPNHLHMIIEMRKPQATLSQIISQYKRAVSIDAGYSPWQKSFHDHIIRDDDDFVRIAKYVDNNLRTWQEDCFHPLNVGATICRPLR